MVSLGLPLVFVGVALQFGTDFYKTGLQCFSVVEGCDGLPCPVTSGCPDVSVQGMSISDLQGQSRHAGPGSLLWLGTCCWFFLPAPVPLGRRGVLQVWPSCWVLPATFSSTSPRPIYWEKGILGLWDEGTKLFPLCICFLGIVIFRRLLRKRWPSPLSCSRDSDKETCFREGALA